MKKGVSKEVKALGTVLSAVVGLKPEQQKWVFSAAISNIGIGGMEAALLPPPGVGAAGGQNPPTAAGAPGASNPKEFMKHKNPQTDVQRVTCLAYYLTKHRNLPHFKSKDLSALNIEAAGSPIGNVSQAIANATAKSLYLAPAGGGKKQITAHGEEVVGVLPDQAGVKVLDQKRPKQRRARRRKTKAKTKP